MNIKKQLFSCLVFSFFMFPTVVVNTQTLGILLKASNDSIDYLYLKNKYPLTNTSYLKMFESEVISYEKSDSINGIKSDNIVFTGSSTMKFWNPRLNKDMSPLPVLGRGFGGSSLIQNIYYFDRLVKPYSPLIEVIYCGNDYSSKPNTVLELFRYYEYLFHEHFPKSSLYFISTNPSICIARIKYINNIDSTNLLIKNYINSRINTYYIDTFNELIHNGVVDLSYFRSDSLHLSDKGYDLITPIIKPVISDKYYNYIKITKQTDETNQTKFYFEKYNDKLYFINIESECQLYIYNSIGLLITSRRVNNNSSLNISNLDHGMYIVNLTIESKIIRQKIII